MEGKPKTFQEQLLKRFKYCSTICPNSLPLPNVHATEMKYVLPIRQDFNNVCYGGKMSLLRYENKPLVINNYQRRKSYKLCA